MSIIGNNVWHTITYNFTYKYKKSWINLVSYWKRLIALCIYDRSSQIASVLKFGSFCDEIPFNRHTHSFEPNRRNQNTNRQKVSLSLGLIHTRRKSSAKDTHIPKLAMVIQVCIVKLKDASALWNFYSAPINVLI